MRQGGALHPAHQQGRLVAFATTFMDARSRPVILAGCALIVLGLAVVDYMTGPELRFFIFYWPPIAVVTWYAGRRWGLAFVVACGAAWLVANPVGYSENARIGLAAWNTAVNAASFALLVVMIAALRRLVDRERLAARVDVVTGVANLRAFSEVIGAEVARSGLTGAPLSLAYLDIDNFKTVNDRLGHAAGDGVLQAVALILRSSLRTGDVVARLGGDEFAVLLPRAGEEEALLIIQRLQRTMDSRAADAGWEISFSIGLVTCAGASVVPEQLLSQADSLMYEAKTAGKSTIRNRLLSSPRS